MHFNSKYGYFTEILNLIIHMNIQLTPENFTASFKKYYLNILFK